MLDPVLNPQENLLAALTGLADAAQGVVRCWESGNLAEAVNKLDTWLTGAREVESEARKLTSEPPKSTGSTVPLWEQDAVQFPRLLSEIMAIVALTEAQTDELCNSMDITPAELYELFERAQTSWEAIKARTSPQ